MAAALWLYKAPTDSVSPSELRYSIRSAVRYLGVDQVYIVGELPEWAANVCHIPGGEDTGSKFGNLYADLLRACQSDELPASFVLMNDDFHALRPYEPGVEHGGRLAARIEDVQPGAFRDAFTYTLEWLQAEGFAEPLTYELHRPLLIEKHDAAETLAEAQAYPYPLHARTMYGALCAIGGEQVADNKLHGYPQPDDWRQLDLVSTSESAWQVGYIGGWLREQSPDPSPFER